MRSGIASPENVTEASGIASPTSSHCLTALARAKLLFFLIQCELLDVVGPVELLALWSCGRRAGVVQAQRQIHRAFAGQLRRHLRTSSHASCWSAPSSAPRMKIGREQS